MFSGSAKIRPDLTAGFEFMTEWSGGARTSTVDQNSPDGNGASLIAGDGTLNVRTANWWLEDKHWGRVTVGRVNVSGPVGTIDLGGISTVAHWSPGLVGGGFLVAGTTRLSGVIGPTYGGDRIEGIRYDTANLGGFVGQAVWGEDDVWSASLRYAGEFGGIRVAAGIGYEAQDRTTVPSPSSSTTASRPIDHEWAGSLASMHVASGLFVQGHYARSEFHNGTDCHVLDDPRRYHEELVRHGQYVVLRRVRQCRELHLGAAGATAASLLPPPMLTSSASAWCSRSMQRPWRSSLAGAGLRPTSLVPAQALATATSTWSTAVPASASDPSRT